LSQFGPVIEEVLSSGGKVKITATGTSMEPVIKNGSDTVTLTAVNKELGIDDIVLFKRDNGKLVLHRIIGKNQTGFVLRGDSQWTTEAVSAENIIAVLDSVERNGKPVNYKKYDKILPVIRWSNRIKKSIRIRLGDTSK
jgi:signal peptidase I